MEWNGTEPEVIVVQYRLGCWTRGQKFALIRTVCFCVRTLISRSVTATKTGQALTERHIKRIKPLRQDIATMGSVMGHVSLRVARQNRKRVSDKNFCNVESVETSFRTNPSKQMKHLATSKHGYISVIHLLGEPTTDLACWMLTCHWMLPGGASVLVSFVWRVQNVVPLPCCTRVVHRRVNSTPHGGCEISSLYVVKPGILTKISQHILCPVRIVQQLLPVSFWVFEHPKNSQFGVNMAIGIPRLDPTHISLMEEGTPCILYNFFFLENW